MSHWQLWLRRGLWSGFGPSVLSSMMAVLPASGCFGQTNPVTATVAQSAAFDMTFDAPQEISDLLANHLELQRYRELTDLSDDELDRLITQTQQDIPDLLATLGYFSPTVTVTRRGSTAQAPAVVHIEVVPGKATRVSQVAIAFNGSIAQDAEAALQRDQIQSTWTLPAGSRFTQSGWDSAKQQALRQLISQRYPTGKITSSVADIDPDAQTAALSVSLDSGPLFRTGAVSISGLQRFDEATVLRLARLSPDSAYDQAHLVAAQQRLTDSGYFDSAYITLDTNTPPEAARVDVKVREAQLQKIVLGVGASTDSGARLTAEHTHHKVPGLDWRAVTKVQLERDAWALGTELTSLLDTDNWRWVASGLVQNELLGTLDVTSQRLRGGRQQITDRIDRNLYLQYDRAESVDTDSAAPVLAQALSANYAFTVRYYDSLPFPSKGWGWGAEVGGGSTLGALPQAYSRVVSRWHGFVPLGEGATQAGSGRLSLRVTLGAVVAEPDISLPSTQLFLAGGDNSVRGYGLRSIGVRLADGTLTAGRYLATSSVEWQSPIRVNGRLSDWEGTMFMDTGAVANLPDQLQHKVGVGVGARWKSPVGPLQVDLAYGVDERRFRLHMALGFTF